MKKIILLAILLSVFTINAQDPNILWQNTVGGDRQDLANSITETFDGGYIIGGRSLSSIFGDKTENNYGEGDYWVVKVDVAGNIEWDKTIGGDDIDIANSIVQTQDGGYVIGGYSRSNISGNKTEDRVGWHDYWIVKINSFGEIEWQNTIGGNDNDILKEIIQTSDGGFLIGGASISEVSGDKTEPSRGGYDYWLLKLNIQGNIEWQKTYGGEQRDELNSFKQTLDGGYILGGHSNSGISGDKTEDSIGFDDYWIIKINSFGEIEWQHTIGGDQADFLISIDKTNDGGYILGGGSNSNISGYKTENSRGDLDYWIVKVDNLGNVEWDKTIGGSELEEFGALKAISSNNYIIVGHSWSNISGDKTEDSNGNADVWIVVINDTGSLLWQNTLGGSGLDAVNNIIQSNDGNFVLCASSSSNISGDKTENSQGEYDYWILKLDNVLGLEENPFATAITLYPNPAKNTLQLNSQDQTINQINIYTITGSKILQLEVDTFSPTVDVSSFATGVYYLQLYSGKNVALKKFVKE